MKFKKERQTLSNEMRKILTKLFSPLIEKTNRDTNFIVFKRVN